MGFTTTYDPTKVIFIIHGNPIGGFVQDTFIEVERDEDSFKLKPGVDGDPCRARINSKVGKIVFKLMQNSPSNIVLSGISTLDEASGRGIGPSKVTDTNDGTTQAVCPDSYLLKPAKIARSGSDIEDVEWTLVCPNLVMGAGGMTVSPL